MQESARLGKSTRGPQVYNKAGRPCPRCGTRIEARGQWEDNRTTFWCPGCQR
jgi:endonuclease-8